MKVKIQSDTILWSTWLSFRRSITDETRDEANDTQRSEEAIQRKTTSTPKYDEEEPRGDNPQAKQKSQNECTS
jgi:hypothetical protein